MAKSKEYKEGYDAAVDWIKNILSGQANQNGRESNNSPSQNDGMDKDLSGTPAGDKMEQQSGSQSSSSGSSEGGQGRGEGDQGTVNDRDCSGQFGSTTPKTPGGFMGAKEGNKLAEAEGYPQGTTDDAIANSWKETAVNAAKNVGAGKNAGSLVSKILDIWNTPTDWKKTFKKIVGKALNKQDKRMGYANKNALVSRNMLLRTEKDKYDAMDYICIFTDSSGSISDNDLRYMLSEIYNIAYSFKPEKLVVGQFDTRITDIQMFNNPSEFKKYVNHATVKGRGGTDCQCIWDLLKKDKRFAKRPPELVIIMTDGYLTQYKRDSRTMNNLCWAILDNARWDVAYRDQRTTCIHLDTKNIKK